MKTKTLKITTSFIALFLVASTALAAPTASSNKTPHIKTLSPDTGEEGEVITMAGSNFGKDPADGIIGLNDGPNYVRVGGYLGTNMLSWANDEVQISAPSLQDAASNISRAGVFFTVADSIGKNIPGLNLLLYATKLLDAATTQKSTFVDNTAPVTVIVYPLNPSNTEYFTYKAKTYSAGIKGIAEKFIDAADVVQVAKITYDSFGKDLVGLATNPVRLVKDKLRDNARSAFETPLLIQDAFSGFKSSEIAPSPPEASIVAPAKKQSPSVDKNQKQPTTQTSSQCIPTGEEIQNDTQLNFPTGTNELKVTLTPNKWSSWITMPSSSNVDVTSSREDEERRIKFSDGTTYTNASNSHNTLGTKSRTFQIISHCPMMITVSITPSLQSVSLSEEVATKILSKFLKDTHYKTEKVMGMGLGYRPEYEAYCFAIFNLAGTGTYRRSLVDNGYIIQTPTDLSDVCLKFTDKSKPYLVYGSDGLVKEVIETQLNDSNLTSFTQASDGRYEVEYTYTNTLTPFAWLSIIGSPKESGSGSANFTLNGTCWNVSSGITSEDLCSGDY